MKKASLTLALATAVTLGAGAQKLEYIEYSDNQGVQNVFVNDAVKRNFELNAGTLREHLAHRRAALLQWQAVDPSELQPVQLKVQAVAKNRGGMRELRVRRFHYLGDCPATHGGQGSGVDTPTTAQAVIASDIADSYLNEAALLGIPIDSLTIELHGRPDEVKTDRVFYPRNFLYTVYIDTPASDEQLALLAERAEANSPIVQFIKLPTVVRHEFDIKASPKKHEVKGSVLAGLREYIQGKRQAFLAMKNAAPKAPAKTPAVITGPVVRVLNSGVRELNINEKYLILNDNPAYLGGYNTGLTSKEHLLAVLGTCITHITEGQAALLGVTLDSLAYTIEADWDPRAGHKGFENVPAYPTNVRFTMHVSTPESRQRIEQLLEAVEKVCPIYNLFKDAPQTFERKIVRIGNKK